MSESRHFRRFCDGSFSCNIISETPWKWKILMCLNLYQKTTQKVSTFRESLRKSWKDGIFKIILMGSSKCGIQKIRLFNKRFLSHISFEKGVCRYHKGTFSNQDFIKVRFKIENCLFNFCNPHDLNYQKSKVWQNKNWILGRVI